MLQFLTVTLIVYSFGSYRKEQIKLFAYTLSLHNMLVISASQKHVAIIHLLLIRVKEREMLELTSADLLGSPLIN